jgi:hypothetical protein
MATTQGSGAIEGEVVPVGWDAVAEGVAVRWQPRAWVNASIRPAHTNIWTFIQGLLTDSKSVAALVLRLDARNGLKSLPNGSRREVQQGRTRRQAST